MVYFDFDQVCSHAWLGEVILIQNRMYSHTTQRLTCGTMASPMAFLFMRLTLLLSVFFTAVKSATVTYNFDIGWTTANPDGAFERPTIGINGQWPIPRISANVGDQVVVNLHNSLGNQSTSLHFHGLFQ